MSEREPGEMTLDEYMRRRLPRPTRMDVGAICANRFDKSQSRAYSA